MTDIKLKLKIKDVEIELTRKEIKELKEILNEIFPTKEVIKEWYPYYPYPYYYGPYTITNSQSDTVDWYVNCNRYANVIETQ